MSILLTGNTMERITDALSTLTVNVKLHNSRGRTDINADAEDFYCGLLNIVLGKNLSNLNALQMDFPAIDLADRDERLCVQVTSTEGREKVSHTLEKFYERDMEREFDRLIVLVIGEKKKFAKAFPNKGAFRFDPKEDIWDTAKLLAEIDRLDAAKQAEVDEYLQKHLNIPAAGPKPIHLPVSTSLGDGGFVGREKELAQMAEALERGVKPLVIWGLGGMGKTELVSQFGRTYRGGNVYMALFREDLRQTVADSIAMGIPELRDRKLSPEERYDLSMDRLRQCPAGDILIIDNADISGGSFMDIKKDPIYKELCGLPLRLVFTTRMQDRDGIELRTMGNSDLYQIFERHGVDLTQPEMDALIAAVNAHTMTVDLMARTLDESWEEVTPQMILEAMASSTLPEADYPEVYNDRDDEQRQIYAHLRSLFNLSNIPEDGKQALRCATLLPAGGMDPVLFLRGLPEGPAKAIKLLEKQGWVQREKHLLTIHPVVRLVCRTELEPTDDNCGEFLRGLWDQCDGKWYDKDKFQQLAEVFSGATNNLEDGNGDYALFAGSFWEELGEAEKAFSFDLRGVIARERNEPDSLGLASAYTNLAKDYLTLKNEKQTFDNLQKAMVIIEKINPKDVLPSVTIGCNLGIAYLAFGQPKEALKYLLDVLRVAEEACISDHPVLADAYIHIGKAYRTLGKHRKARGYFDRGADIQAKVYPPNHPVRARTYFEIGVTYNNQLSLQEALDWHLEAMVIEETMLPMDHPQLARTYENVGIDYSNLGDIDKSLEYTKKALEIWEKKIPLSKTRVFETCIQIIICLCIKVRYEEIIRYLDTIYTIEKTYPSSGRHKSFLICLSTSILKLVFKIKIPAFAFTLVLLVILQTIKVLAWATGVFWKIKRDKG